MSLPVACAVGVEPSADGTGGSGGTGGAAVEGGSAGTGGAPGAFGGTASTGGKGGTSAGGTSAGGTSAGGTSAGGASAGTAAGGSNAGTGGASGGGASTGGGGGAGGSGVGCGCARTIPWTNGMVFNATVVTGDCVSSGDKTFKYIGTKDQTFANADCNPGGTPMAWCADTGNDYKFMACP